MKSMYRQCAVRTYAGLQSAVLVQSRIPVLRCPRDVLVRLECSSLNPLDRRMAEGYGQEVLNKLRVAQQGMTGQGFGSEFPLVLGRDFAGTVLDSGSSAFKEFKPGTKVFGATFPSQTGTHQEYIKVDMSSLTKKPKSLSNSAAASIPYAGLTAWAALVTTGGLKFDNAASTRVLVVGGSGGVGSVAVQLGLAAGAEVVAVAGPKFKDTLTELGATFLNYKDDNYARDLIALSGFDIVLDCAGLGTKSSNLAPLLRTGGCVVTLDSPLLKNTDSQGLIFGGVQSVLDLIQSNFKAVESGNTVRWGYFAPSQQGMDVLTSLLEEGKLKPIIDQEFSFTSILEAYAYYTGNKTNGKVIINFESE